ncbi:MAG: hypothetical protein KDA41_06430, partial [Planctomycetales bacterium]|nr:hypothetical protein [Planctomycetales bacterium]
RSTERGGERREPGSSTRSRGGRRRQRGGDERGERKARSSNPAERREQRKPVGPAGPAGPAGEETAATDPARRRRRRRRGRTDSREIQTPAAESIEPKTDALGFPDEDAWFEESPLASETAAQEDDDSAELPPERQLERDPDGEDVFALIDDEAPPQKGELQYIAAVRVHNLGDKVHLFSCKNDGVEPGTPVVVETDRGLAIGTVISRPTRQMRDSDVPKLLRALDNSDRRQQQRNVARQAEAHALCQAQIRQNRLQMKLVRTEYLHAGNKALFFFAAENRVDFRSLVKELASRLHVRIEMRQIGVRDAAGFTGGIGSCGQELCCSRFLQGFDPVSIRM